MKQSVPSSLPPLHPRLASLARNLLSLAAFAGPGLAQQTWYVDANAGPGGDGSQGSPFSRIQSAVSQTSTHSGDTLLVLPGIYSENIDYVGKRLVLRSLGGAASTTIVGQGGAVVRVASAEGNGTRLEGFTVTGGSGEPSGGDLVGGGIYCNGASLSVVDCIVRQNSATLGGGIRMSACPQVELTRTVLLENSAVEGAGLSLVSSSATIVDCLFERNSVAFSQNSGGGGGGLKSEAGTLLVRDTVFCANTTGGIGSGAGAFINTPGAVFTDCEIVRNQQGQQAQLPFGSHGAGFVSLHSDSVYARCHFEGNIAVQGLGGGFYGAGQLQDCTFRLNTSMRGGGAYEEGGLSGFGCLFEDNQAIDLEIGVGWGGGAHGGIYTSSVFTNNFASFMGGGAYGASLSNCRVESNSARGGSICGDSGGGGLASCIATDCALSRNTVTPLGANCPPPVVVGGGGALESTLNHCQVQGNSISTSGDPEMRGGGTLDCQLTNCLISGNTCSGAVDGAGKGGGIYGGSADHCQILNNQALMSSALVNAVGGGAAAASLQSCVIVGNVADHGAGTWGCTIERSTISQNTATISGGAVSGSPSPGTQAAQDSMLTNCILWGNQPSEVSADGGSITIAYSDVAGGHGGTGNIGLDPAFWSAVGSDFHLTASSPCIDAGDPQSAPDPDGSPADMGALPHDPAYLADPYVYCEAKLNSVGCSPSVAWTGSPSLSAPDDFVVSATQLVNQKPVIAIWSRFPAATPFSGGILCLAGQIVRTPPSGSGGSGPGSPPDCSGSASFHFSHAYAAANFVPPGTQVYFQFWYRDPAHPDGSGVGLSNALNFLMLP